jgi:enoyl-CoA hydratase/carnithine racemase
MLILAMEMVLTGEPMKAQEALSRGLVSKVVAPEKTLNEAIELAKKISAKPRLICKYIFL